jgi:ABC-type multidrug transport system ATPase subunit
MQKVIEVKDLVKDYKTTHAVQGVSFSVEKGEIFGILGPNGAGKTTTLEIIECLKPQTSGKVTVLGFDNLESPNAIKNKIGVQLQSSQYLHHLSLSELLDLFRSFYPATSLRVQPTCPTKPWRSWKQSNSKDEIAASPRQVITGSGTPRNDTGDGSQPSLG